MKFDSGSKHVRRMIGIFLALSPKLHWHSQDLMIQGSGVFTANANAA